CLAHDKIVDIEIMIVLGVGDGRLQHLLHLARDAFGREGQRRQCFFRRLTANRLRHQIELARRGTNVAADRLGLGVAQRSLVSRFAHSLAASPSGFLTLRSAEWPWKIRVGENSPNLWPTMSSVTITGICLTPL